MKIPPLDVSDDPIHRQKLFGLDETHHPDVKKLARWGEWLVRRIANNNAEKGRHVVFCGGTGCGKTHVAKKVYRFIRDYSVDLSIIHGMAHPMPRWIEWPDIADSEDDDFDDVLYEVERAGFVAIDELGAETDRYKSGIANTRMRKILELCVRKWLVVTSNSDKEKILAAYDVRVADRLRTAHWVALHDIPSYRPKLKVKV